MKLAIGTFLMLSLFVQFSQAQAGGSNPSGVEAPVTAPAAVPDPSRDSYTVFNATAEQEAALRAQIRQMHPDVLPLRVFFVSHGNYLAAARNFHLRVPTGYGSLMFTHLPSRTIFIDNDRYLGENWLGHWIAHELGHLVTNSTKEQDAEKAAHQFRKRLENPRRRTCIQSTTNDVLRYKNCSSKQPPDEEQLQLGVRFYNYARISDGEVRAAEKVVARVLTEARIQLEWTGCITNQETGSVPSPCDASARSTDLVLYSVGPLEKHFEWADCNALGYSIIPDGHELATMAYVSYPRIRVLSAYTSVDEVKLLGLTLAHEIGHLLFGSHDQANQGIMRASWHLRDLENRGWELHFTGDQSQRLRAAVQARLSFAALSWATAYAKEPPQEGSLEYSPEFRKAAAEAWKKANYGNSNKFTQGAPEAGFTINRDGTISVITVAVREDGPGGMEFRITPNTLATFHTHSDPYSRRPSVLDEQSAKTKHSQIYVGTKDGLFLIGPDGRTTQIFRRGDWATKKNPE